MDNKNKNDVAAKPQAGASDPKEKHAHLEEHPRKGRERVPSTQDEIGDATENPTAPHKARTQQYGKNYRHKTN
jgi:hypothetical protein